MISRLAAEGSYLVPGVGDHATDDGLARSGMSGALCKVTGSAPALPPAYARVTGEYPAP